MAKGNDLTFSPDEILRYYSERAPALRRNGEAELRGPCPIHHGQNPNFVVDLKSGLFNCFSKCGRGGNLLQFEMAIRGSSFSTACDEVLWLMGRSPAPKRSSRCSGGGGPRIVARYEYRDEQRTLLFRVCRTEPKAFYMEQPTPGYAAWVRNMKGVRRVLYRLPELIARTAEPIFFVEGEKDADTLAQLGLLATTSPGGASGWRAEFAQTLAGRDIVIVPDGDLPGRRYASQVAADLLLANSSVRLIDLPNGKDVSDFLSSGRTLEDLQALTQKSRLTTQELAPWRRQWSIDDGSQPEPKQPVDDSDWQSNLIRHENGSIISNLANVALGLSSDPRWKGGLTFNRFSGGAWITEKAPAGIDRGQHDDHISAQIRIWLEREFIPKVPIESVWQAVDVIARANPWHPICDYLDALKWDGQARIPTFFKIYFTAKGNDRYLREVATMFLISAVARVYKPGCQADYMLVLEGAQGIYKSQALRTVFGAPYFTDQMPSLDTRDASIQLRGKWCIEFAEFDRLSKHAASTVKAYVTRCVDVYRPCYGRLTVDVPRQCVFAATVNAKEYLTDEGNRRFWPISCRSIQIDLLRRDRDQIWAEVVHLYREGIPWWPSSKLVKKLEKEQELREFEDPFYARILEWLDVSKGNIAGDKHWVTTSRVLQGLQIPPAQLKSVEQDVGRCLRKLGYKKDQFGKDRLRYWRK